MVPDPSTRYETARRSLAGQRCPRFTAQPDEGAFYEETSQLARVTRAGPGIGGQVTFTQVGEPVAISDPERG